MAKLATVYLIRKSCSKCNVEKPISEFYQRADKLGCGLQSWCKPCVRKKNKESADPEKKKINNKMWVQKNPDRKKHIELMYKFGISFEEYSAIFKKQDGKCAICFVSNDHYKKSLAVDHCHKTMKIRGLLCLKCNHGLGQFSDNIELLKTAIKYLEAHHR